MEAGDHCGHCGAGQASKKCTCRKVAYCNNECQRSHWKAHRPKHKITVAAAAVAAKLNHKSEAGTLCQHCGKDVKKSGGRKSIVNCECTAVIFCSRKCKKKAIKTGKHKCDGAPSTNTTCGESLKNWKTYKKNNHVKEIPFDEQEVNALSTRVALKVYEKGIATANGKLPNFYSYKQLADEYQDVEAMYQAGITAKHRLCTNKQDNWLTHDQHGNLDSKGVLETQQLAITYLTRSAQGGCRLAMVSLATWLMEGGDEGQITEISVDRIQAAEWAWRAHLMGAEGMQDTMQGLMLCQDAMATVDGVENMIAQHGALLRAHGGHMSGPNLASLMLSRCEHNELFSHKYNIPSRLGGEASGFPVVNAKQVQQLDNLCREYKFAFGYGRYGSASAATALAGGGSSRSIGNTKLKMSKIPTIAASFKSDESIARAYQLWKQSYPHDVQTHCHHAEQHPQNVCIKCIEDGKRRLQAAANGLFAVSISNPSTSAHGSVVYGYNGEKFHEHYKIHSRPEIDCVLSFLASDSHYQSFAHPCFIAQDPTLIWPVLLYYGSIRAALQHVAPNLDWTFLGNIEVPSPSYTSSLHSFCENAVPGSLVYRCGSDVCCNLSATKNNKNMKRCVNCFRRSYCSRTCQASDWVIHKKECGNCKANTEEKATTDFKGTVPQPGLDLILVGDGRKKKWLCVHGREHCSNCLLDLVPVNQACSVWECSVNGDGKGDGGSGGGAKWTKDVGGNIVKRRCWSIRSDRTEAGAEEENYETKTNYYEPNGAVPKTKRGRDLSANCEKCVEGAGTLQETVCATAFACYVASRDVVWIKKGTDLLFRVVKKMQDE